MSCTHTRTRPYVCTKLTFKPFLQCTARVNNTRECVNRTFHRVLRWVLTTPGLQIFGTIDEQKRNLYRKSIEHLWLQKRCVCRSFDIVDRLYIFVYYWLLVCLTAESKNVPIKRRLLINAPLYCVLYRALSSTNIIGIAVENYNTRHARNIASRFEYRIIHQLKTSMALPAEILDAHAHLRSKTYFMLKQLYERKYSR